MQTVQQLNRHPLNQAARRRLLREHGQQLPHRMHLLSLAHHGLEDAQGDPLEGDHPARKPLEDYSLSPRLQASALANLQGALDPSEVDGNPLSEVASRISECLKSAGTRGYE
jgi:hypothetical protein